MLAADESLPGSRQALEQLCQKYWPPVYSFLRRQGNARDEAQDLTQGFFLHLLQGRRLRRIDASKGRLRSFFLAAVQNYVENQRDWARAKKRGGGQIAVLIEFVDPVAETDPAVAFDERWAALLFTSALEKLRQQCVQKGKGELFESLRGFLTSEFERGEYEPLARDLEINVSALRAAVSRMRGEFREILRAEVSRTVADPADIEEELRYLMALAGKT
jgi:RNA polymerase sigma-70 factor (ECF subfamily)